MSTTFNDGIYTKAPKPTDLKSYVGNNPFLEFATKEEIPKGYRFVGMEIINVNDKSRWRLIDNTNTNGTWEEIKSIDNKLKPYTHVVTENEMDNNEFTFPITGYTIENTKVIINGISIFNFSEMLITMYMISTTSTTTKISFNFPLETNDVIQLIKT